MTNSLQVAEPQQAQADPQPVVERLRTTCGISLKKEDGHLLPILNESSKIQAALSILRGSMTGASEPLILGRLAVLWASTLKAAEMDSNRKMIWQQYAKALSGFPGDIVISVIDGWTDMEPGGKDFPQGGRFWPSLSDLKMLAKREVRARKSLIERLSIASGKTTLTDWYFTGDKAFRLRRAKRELMSIQAGERPLGSKEHRRMSPAEWEDAKPQYLAALQVCISKLEASS